ncbi:MAG: hypothetical protein JWO67_6963 [Streptosporangiaceae bacterium]|nr:hypothetical protein [Streptosporangiaceae bacterium]
MGSVVSTMAPFFAAKTINAPAMRQAMGAIWADGPVGIGAETGVVPSGGNSQGSFSPTSVGSSSAPAVSLSPGQCVIQRPTGGTYVCTLPVASGNITLTTPLPASGQTRIDVVCASVVDGEADGGTPPQTNTLTLSTVTGTAAASPTVPSVPAGFLPLWNVTVNNAGALTFADARIFTRGVGGVRFVQAGDTRAGSYPADLRIFATGQVDCWLNPTGTWAWITIVAPSVWTQVSLPYSYAGGSGGTCNLGTTGSTLCRYKRAGNDLALSYEALWGGPPYNMGNGAINTVLPNGWVTPTGRDQWMPCQLFVNDSVSGFTGNMAGLALVKSGSNQVRPYFPRDGGFSWLFPYTVQQTIGTPGQSYPQVGNGYAQGGSLHIAGTIELAS